MTYDDFIENFARAWASMDGKAEEFDKCKADPQYDMGHGYYMGYIEETREVFQRSGMEAHIKMVSKIIGHLTPEQSGRYFICGEGGEKDKNGMPDRIHVCPTYGLDWFHEYTKTDKTHGPEW
jgi:hypothetical protein